VASLYKGKEGVAFLFKGKGSWPDYLNKSGRGLICFHWYGVFPDRLR
jgi:hypothetical protein